MGKTSKQMDHMSKPTRTTSQPAGGGGSGGMRKQTGGTGKGTGETNTKPGLVYT